MRPRLTEGWLKYPQSPSKAPIWKDYRPWDREPSSSTPKRRHRPTAAPVFKGIDHCFRWGPVWGNYWRLPGGIVNIPVLNCDDPGKGHVSAFLDELPKAEVFEITAIVNPILRGALERRNWTRLDPEGHNFRRERILA